MSVFLLFSLRQNITFEDCKLGLTPFCIGRVIFQTLSPPHSSQSIGRLEDFDFGCAGAWIGDCIAEAFSTSQLASSFSAAIFLHVPVEKEPSTMSGYIRACNYPCPCFLSIRTILTPKILKMKELMI